MALAVVTKLSETRPAAMVAAAIVTILDLVFEDCFIALPFDQFGHDDNDEICLPSNLSCSNLLDCDLDHIFAHILKPAASLRRSPDTHEHCRQDSQDTGHRPMPDTATTARQSNLKRCK